MNIALFANPRAGGRDCRHLIDSALKFLDEHTIGVDLFISRYPGHSREQSADLDVSGVDAVAVMGGDGSNFQVINGLLGKAGEADVPPLAAIPMGRGNSFARELGVFRLEDGLRALIGGVTRPVDVCAFTQPDGPHVFINLMGTGFVSAVAGTAARFRRAGDFSYVIGVLYHALMFRDYPLEMEIDGTDYSGDNCFVEFCNSRYTGGAMMIAPDARIDDGYFDAVIVEPMSTVQLLKTFPLIYSGTHAKSPAVRMVRGRRASVRIPKPGKLLPDGELFGTAPTTVTAHPRRLSFYCLPSAAT